MTRVTQMFSHARMISEAKAAGLSVPDMHKNLSNTLQHLQDQIGEYFTDRNRMSRGTGHYEWCALNVRKSIDGLRSARSLQAMLKSQDCD